MLYRNEIASRVRVHVCHTVLNVYHSILFFHNVLANVMFLSLKAWWTASQGQIAKAEFHVSLHQKDNTSDSQNVLMNMLNKKILGQFVQTGT